MRYEAVDWVVSHQDITDLSKQLKDDSLSKDQLLSRLGMDVRRGYVTDDRHLSEKPENWDELIGEHHGYTHRSAFTRKLVVGPRYVGKSRTDGKWARFCSDFIDTISR